MSINFVCFNALDSAERPFEFQGSLGTQTKAKQEVLDWILPDPIKVKSQGGNAAEVASAALDFRNSSPLFGQLLTPNLLDLFKQSLANSPLRDEFYDVLPQLESFLEKVNEFHAGLFLADCPIVKIDRHLDEGLPILNSTTPLQVGDFAQLINNFTEALCGTEWSKTEEALKRGCDTLKIQKIINKTYTPENLERLLGPNASDLLDLSDLNFFSSRVGQLFLYWIQSAFFLQKAALRGPEFLEQINRVKEAYQTTISDTSARVNFYTHQLKDINASVLATQECNKPLYEGLCEQYLDPVTDLQQNPGDGTFVFLKKGAWQDGKSVSLVQGKEDWATRGKVNAVMARHIESQVPFLICSLHCESKDEQDAFNKMESVLATYKFYLANCKDLTLLVGADTNTKKTFKAFERFLESNKLTHTGELGVTTLKERALTVQYPKAGSKIEARGDYIIVGSENARVSIKEQQLGIKDPLSPHLLPSINCPSDHLPVTANLLVS